MHFSSIFIILLVQQKVGSYSINEGESLTRSCSSGYYLDITYGRWYCSYSSNTVTSVMSKQCAYSTSCTVSATNKWLGRDPCPGTGKTLEWSDSCVSNWGDWGSWSDCPSDCTTQNLVRYRSCVKPGGGCSSAPADYISCLRVGCLSTSEISRYTPDDSVNYLSLSSNCFALTGRTSYTFRVKAHNDVHMALGSVDSYTSGTHYEVLICGWANTRSTIRYSIRGSECVAYSATLLNQTYFDDFWVSWSGGKVKAGTGSTVGSNTFMTCSHSPSYEVNYILIKTGWNSTGDWRFPNDVACTHETNSNVNVATDNTSCNGVSSYACASSYKRAAGNTQRTCQVQKVWSEYPLICAVSTCKIDILFIIEASYYTASIHSSLMTVIGDLVGLMAISTNDIQVGVITYDNVVDENIKLNAYSSATALDAAISSITIPSASSSVYIDNALRVGFYDFVKLSNGNRFDAYRYFILIAKTYSSNYDRDVANAMRQNPRNQVFTIGISPSSSLISDLKLSAGDDNRYLQLSTPTDLYPHFNTFLQKIVTCPATAPVQRTVSCKLDIAFIVENYNLRFIKRFVVDLMDDIPVSSNGVRVGFVIFDSGARTEFGLSNYTSNEALRGAIEGIEETSSSYHYVDKGLIEARDNVFTAAGGDRTDAPNYYVFVVGPFYRNTDAVARDVSSSGNNFIFAVHIGSSYHSEYQASVDSCGDYSKYTNINLYNNLVTIREQVIGNITTCRSVVETTPGCKLDIAFIMDDSTSVSSTEFTDMKSFFKSLVARMVVGDTTVRIGVVTFGDGAVTAFPLNQYSTSADVIAGIEGISRGNSSYGRSYRYVDRALEYTQKSFFTKANGDHTDAANYYVILTHGYSYGYKTTEFGSVLRSMTSVINDIFIVGVGITSSTYDADYQGAVSDTKKYIESSNFIELQCINDMMVSNITTCPSASISPFTPVNPSCKLDIVFILETNTYSSDENYIYLKDFFSKLVQQIGVSSDTIRIGAIRYNSKAYTAFDLQTYTTSDDVSDALLQLSDSTDSGFLIDSALSYAQSTFFTAANGDRDDAANYYVFTIDGIRSGAAKQGELIAANWPDTVFAIDINSSFPTEYENTTGDSSRYFYAASYADLSSIESSVLAAISGCPVPITTTTTTTIDRSATTTVDDSRENVNVSAPCPNSLLYLYPEDLTASNDGAKGMMYLMTDFVFAAPSCSRITSWEFSYSKSGWIDFMVWRPLGNKYKLVAYNTIYVDGANTTVYTVEEYQKIAVLENDVIGWRCEGDNVITNGDCLGPCAEGFKVSTGSIDKGDEFDWANLGTAITGTAYAIKACLENNTVIAFSNSTFSVKIPDHLTVGSFVLLLEVTGVDYTEEVNFTALQHPSFTHALQYFAVDQMGQITVAKKLTKANITKDFVILVEVKDSCQYSATATVSIETQTMGPICLLKASMMNGMSTYDAIDDDESCYTLQISLDTSNIESIAAGLANLTSNPSELDVSDVVYTAVILQNIAKIPSISVQTLDDVLQTFTNVLEAPESILKTARDIDSSTTSIIESVETITRNTAFNGGLYQNFQKGYAVAVVAPDAPSVVAIQVKKKDGNADLSNETVNLITAEEYSNLSSVNAGIVLPEVSVHGNKTKAIFTVYENTKLFQVRSNNKRYELNGNVCSATLITEGKVVTDLGGKFVTSVYKPLNDTVESVCGFWNHSLYDTSGGWSTNGCQKTQVMDDGRVVCQCDHLTNFAILLDIKGQGDIIDPTNTLILSVITIIGFSLSIIGLGFTVLSFILFKPLRQGRGQQTLLNLALALLCSMIIFLAGIERTESYYGCIAVAALMHYFLLVSFMWMLVEGFLQYLRFVRVLGTYIPRFMLKASIPAWGLPLLPVIIVLAVDYDLYKGGNYYCWMSRTPFYFAFLIPVALIILINCIIFFMVLKTLLTRSKSLQSNQSESKRAMMNLRASISIFIILGLSWTFGILAIEDARVVFSYIFTILTTFQGFIIFILFIARGKKLRYNWKKLCCKRFEEKRKKYKVTSDSSGNSALKFNNASYDSHTASTELK